VDIIPWVIHGRTRIQERNRLKKVKVKGRRINEKQNETRRIALYQYIRNIYMKKYKGSGKSVKSSKRPGKSVKSSKRPGKSVKSTGKSVKSSSRPLTRGYSNTLKRRPSKRYCKHGWVWSIDEQNHYRQHHDDYKIGNTIEERCGDFYSADEIAQMKSEITEAKCSICYKKIKTEPLTECIMCKKLHSFHHKCLLPWWLTSPDHDSWCPLCMEEMEWKICKTSKDLHSGGNKKYSKLKKTIRNRKPRK